MWNKIISSVVLFLCFVDVKVQSGSLEVGAPLSRHKRFLVFPRANPTRFQIVFGVGLPVVIEDHAITVGYVFKGLYRLPYNASQITQPNIDYARKKRDHSTPQSQYTRWGIYKVLETLASSYGMEGRACVLRAICEAAENPFTHRNGILGELAHVILSPSTTNEDLDHHLDNQYLAAEKIGKDSKYAMDAEDRCGLVFRECQSSLLEMFTSVEYVYKNMVKK